jgi:hypothetical protein
MEEQTQLVREISLPLFQVKGWLKLLGVVMIVQGILTAFTIIGIIFAWLPIWLGVLLFQAASATEAAQASGDRLQLMSSLNKLKMYFIINGVLMLISLAFVALMVFILLATGLGSMYR